MNNLMNLIMGLWNYKMNDKTREKIEREYRVNFEPDMELEDGMEEKCTVCGAESQADCKCPDDCPSCGA